eukprot:1487267-Heterocapsa_arctica.AAC.1
MPPHDNQFLEPHDDAEADQTDDELSSDDILTGDRPIKSGTGFFSPSPGRKRNLQDSTPPGEGRWDRRLR